MRLVDWLDDLCVRFIINLPHEELGSVERICFQIEEAQWFYEDFIRPNDLSMPSMNLHQFALAMFKHCPLSSGYPQEYHEVAYRDFLAYKKRVPVRGAIMLNADMTKAVLVKGWKKSASWSFPRGKINRDEPDLECAVREVYEETGFDLKEAGLVKTEEETKSIEKPMREQDIKLYVFRGVPENAHFEPRTRKEISKIDWYKISDLPTQKRKNQVQQEIGQNGRDTGFYMVATFLGPLKEWIKEQRKLDKQRARTGRTSVQPVTAGVTDTERNEADVADTTADEEPVGENQPADPSFASLIANMGRGPRHSDALPEVSTQHEPSQVRDPAEELRRLFGVGSGQAPPVQSSASAQGPPANGLMAMLQANSGPPPPLPRTPMDHLMSPPAQPHSPHGQHHPRPPNFVNMPPPPAFSIQPQPQSQPHQSMPYRGQQPPQMPHQHMNGVHMPSQRDFLTLPHQQQHQQHSGSSVSTRTISTQHSTHAPHLQPHLQEVFNNQQDHVRPYQRIGDPQFAQAPQFPELHGPAIPPASKLPPPKLTAHALTLLNTLKKQDKPSLQSPSSQETERVPQSQTQQRMQPPQVQQPQAQPQSMQQPMQQPHAQQTSIHRSFDSFTLPQQKQQHRPYDHAPSPPSFQSPPPNVNFQTLQPKPRSAHQDALLSMFHSPSMTAATPPPPPTKGPEPVELSAHPLTPGYSMLQRTPRDAGPPKPDLSIKPNLLDVTGQAPKPDITSATVSGPVNVPDFETVKKNIHPGDLSGHSRGPSPAQAKNVPQKPFIPQKILRREGAPAGISQSPVEIEGKSRRKPPSPTAASKIAPPQTQIKPQPPVQQKAFQPVILKRPQQSQTVSPVPAPPARIRDTPDNQGLPTQPRRLPVASVASVDAAISSAPANIPAPMVAAAPSTLAAPVAPAAHIRRENTPDQKSALLSLFNKPSVPAPKPAQISRSPVPPMGLPNPPAGLPVLPTVSPGPISPVPNYEKVGQKSHLAFTKSPTPAFDRVPTPRSRMSGVISPISPLPEHDGPLHAHTNAQGSTRSGGSRISSLGDSGADLTGGMMLGMDIPRSEPVPNNNGTGRLAHGYASTGPGSAEPVNGGVSAGKAKKVESGVDKDFLRGFLDAYASKGGR